MKRILLVILIFSAITGSSQKFKRKWGNLGMAGGGYTSFIHPKGNNLGSKEISPAYSIGLTTCLYELVYPEIAFLKRDAAFSLKDTSGDKKMNILVNTLHIPVHVKAPVQVLTYKSGGYCKALYLMPGVGIAYDYNMIDNKLLAAKQNTSSASFIISLGFHHSISGSQKSNVNKELFYEIYYTHDFLTMYAFNNTCGEFKMKNSFLGFKITILLYRIYIFANM